MGSKEFVQGLSAAVLAKVLLFWDLSLKVLFLRSVRPGISVHLNRYLFVYIYIYSYIIMYRYTDLHIHMRMEAGGM